MPKQTDKELELFFKNARHEQKLTYEELAEKAEMSSRYLKEIENGGRVPSFHKIRKLVRALNVPPEPFRSRLRSCRTGRNISCFLRISSGSDGYPCKIILLYYYPFYVKLWIDTSEQHTLFINRMIGVISWN